MRNKSKYSTIQRYLKFKEIKQDVIVMPNGSLRAILMVSSINFSLKSKDEQEAIISSYINFLNSLNFPIQILVQSRVLNLDSYLQKLKEMQELQPNDLLKMQIKSYIDFLNELVSLGEIMDKKFFIIIPYGEEVNLKSGFLKEIIGIFKPSNLISVKKEAFNKQREKLLERVNFVGSALQEMGLTAVMLTTEAIIELLYKCYNPSLSQRQKFVSLNEIQINK